MPDNAPPMAELSSLATVLDDVAKRVTDIAERASGTSHEWLAADLFHVERSLGEARRRMASIADRVRR